MLAENSLDGYVVTVTARETLRRLISALENHASSKAWSLTGPYGSGKSAFALFAAKLLGDPDSPAAREASRLLEHGDVLLWNQFADVRASRQKGRGFCPVLISGERAPITIALLQGLAVSLCEGRSNNRHITVNRGPRLLPRESPSELNQLQYSRNEGIKYQHRIQTRRRSAER